MNDLYLNPGTHRIRAQRTHKPDQDRNLDKDPFGEAARTTCAACSRPSLLTRICGIRTSTS
ncbi:hypothetical protein ACFQ3Z_18655 [Streptomyces nogalater]